MSTPQIHVDAVKRLCEVLSASPLVKRAWVDDWGRFSNFSVMVVPMEHDRHTTNRLRGLMTRYLKGTGAHLRACFPPDPEFSWDSCEQRRVIRGYNRSYWSFDVDFLQYDHETNRFS